MKPWLAWSLVGAFLFGSACQILLAFLNKVVSWRLHEAEHLIAIGGTRSSVTHPGERQEKFEARKARLRKLELYWRPVSEMFWIDLWCDGISLICFAYVITVLAITLTPHAINI
jgi:hypothetical protein